MNPLEAMPHHPAEIAMPKLLLVEGKDEENFFRVMLSHMGIHDVQPWEVGGKQQFASKFPGILVATGFEQVEKYAIIRDAEDDSIAAFQSVRDLLERHEQACPEKPGEFAAGSAGQPAVGVYIMPGGGRSGMLEDLCLATVSGHPVIRCVHSYMECLRASLQKKPSDEQRHPAPPYYPANPTKTSALAFLAGLYHDVRSVGVAALKGYWNFDHAALNDLRSFLAALR